MLYEALCGVPAFDPDVPAVDRPAPKRLDDSDTARLALQLLDADPSRRPELDDAVQELARICADGGMAFRPDWAR